MNDAELLKRYVQEGSEPAFTELVERHLNLVFAAALRQVGGDRHLAQDVAQTVFTDLARQASTLSARENVAGWLYTSARFAASKVVRTEQRRHAREQKAFSMADPNDDAPAWEQIQPVLDEAIHDLNAGDRNALVLRFFQGKPLDQVGSDLGVTGDAARMRIDRALEKLKKLLGRRGVTTTVAGLAIVMTQQASTAAPAGLSAAIAGAALASTATTSAATFSILEIILMSKAKAALVVAVLAGASIPLVVQQRENSALQERNTQLSQQLGATLHHIDPLMEENARLSNALASVQPSARVDNELLKLRAEVAQLRAEKRATTNAQTMRAQALGDDPLQETLRTLGDRAGRLKARVKDMPERQIPELALVQEKDWLDAVARVAGMETDDHARQALSNLRAAAKGAFGDAMKKALQKFADSNGGMMPANVSELAPYMPETTNIAMLERYKMLQSGMLDAAPRDQALIGESAPAVDDEYDTVFKFHRQGTSSSSVNQVRTELKDAAIAYAKANDGVLPRSPDQIAQYLKRPVDPEKVQRFFNDAPPGVKTLDDLMKLANR